MTLFIKISIFLPILQLQLHVFISQSDFLSCRWDYISHCDFIWQNWDFVWLFRLYISQLPLYIFQNWDFISNNEEFISHTVILYCTIRPYISHCDFMYQNFEFISQWRLCLTFFFISLFRLCIALHLYI